LCADSWHSNYNGAPTDGSAWINNDNQNRVLPGGSWGDDPAYCRSAIRGNSTRDNFYYLIGFRVVFVPGSGG
jgi:formylglycine-generating enzyme required for sulfatase activity